MEASDQEVTACRSYEEYVFGVVRGRRTKRGRRLSTSPSISSAEEYSGSTIETPEEDLAANCLILLAQGQGLDASGDGDGDVDGDGDGDGDGGEEKLLHHANTRNYVYRCRTCGKCFSSFQALGGHRTSHKRPKMVPAATLPISKSEASSYNISTALEKSGSRRISVASSYPDTSRSNTNIIIAGKLKSHECSVCGLEFSSGQALGGHMRRHRSNSSTAAIPTVVFAKLEDEATEKKEEEKKKKNVFGLDLNLPAPSDDEVAPESSSSAAGTFAFDGKEPLLFPALVGCHY